MVLERVGLGWLLARWSWVVVGASVCLLCAARGLEVRVTGLYCLGLVLCLPWWLRGGRIDVVRCSCFVIALLELLEACSVLACVVRSTYLDRAASLLPGAGLAGVGLAGGAGD